MKVRLPAGMVVVPILASLSLLFVNVAQASLAPIIGGTTIPIDDPIAHQVVALIAQLPQGQALCTASLISDSLAITAAHCVSDESGNPLDPSKLMLLFGLDARSPQTIKKTVSAAVPNPMYKARMNEELDNGDVALVKFDGGLPSGYAPAKVLTNPSQLLTGTQVVLAGYGIDNGTTHAGAGTLRRVSVSIKQNNFSKTEVLMDQTQGGGACHGDSGGPAYLQSGSDLLLWGVTSRGIQDPRNDCTVYAAYTDLVMFSAWINQTAQTLRVVPPLRRPIDPGLRTGRFEGVFRGPPAVNGHAGRVAHF